MKKLVFAFCLMAGTAIVVNAQEATSVPKQQQEQAQRQDDDEDREPIAVSELPSAARQSLQSQDYSGWTVANAYKKEKDNGEVMYSAELQSGDETKIVKFDAQGNKVKEKDKDKHKDH